MYEGQTLWIRKCADGVSVIKGDDILKTNYSSTFKTPLTAKGKGTAVVEVYSGNYDHEVEMERFTFKVKVVSEDVLSRVSDISFGKVSTYLQLDSDGNVKMTIKVKATNNCDKKVNIKLIDLFDGKYVKINAGKTKSVKTSGVLSYKPLFSNSVEYYDVDEAEYQYGLRSSQIKKLKAGKKVKITCEDIYAIIKVDNCFITVNIAK